MSVKNNYLSLKRAMQRYSDLLESYSDTDFIYSPAKGGWSYAEVYAHITSSNQLSIRAIKKCAEHRADEVATRVDWRVAMILFAGRLPKGRKVPQRLADTIVKMSREEARQKVDEVMEILEATYPLMAKASPTQKLKHPRLGYLNAAQWLRFVEIHSYHHLRQLERIRKALAQEHKN